MEDKNNKPEDLKRAVIECPKDCLEVKSGKLVISDPLKCDLCMKCSESVESVHIKPNATKFIFRVESISGLKNTDIVEIAGNVLLTKSEDFKKNAAKL